MVSGSSSNESVPLLQRPWRNGERTAEAAMGTGRRPTRRAAGTENFTSREERCDEMCKGHGGNAVLCGGRTISGCLAALVVMGVVGVASAWASAPEVGRCLKVAAGTGKFSSATCTAEKAKGSYEWTPTGGKLKFKTVGGVGTLETINGTTVGCNTEESGGEFNSPKTVTGIVVRFTGCHSVRLHMRHGGIGGRRNRRRIPSKAVSALKNAS